jgi:DNA polymerase-3 subunit beta
LEFTCSKDKLSSALGVIQGVVSTRATLPILANVLIEASDGFIELTATDLELSLKTRLEIDILEEGSITVPAKKLNDIVNGLDADEEIVIKTEDQKMNLKCESAEFNLQGISSDEFPKWPEVEDGISIKVSGKTVAGMYGGTVFAVSKDETRYALNGVCTQIEGQKMITVATDGYLLAYSEIELDGAVSGIVDTIVPETTAKEISRHAKNVNKIDLIFGENYLVMDGGSVQLASRVIEGRFPQYRDVIPEAFPNKVVLSREEFLNKVNLVSILSDERSNQIEVSLNKNMMEIYAQSQEYGKGSDSLEVTYDGEDIRIGYNANFMKLVIRSFTEDELEFEFIDAVKQAKISPVGNDKHFCIIMPIKI